MPDTFGGEHHRTRRGGRGHSQRQLQDRASFDNEPQLGCGALFMLCVLAVAAAVGLTLL
jgi:hypothetical protein